MSVPVWKLTQCKSGLPQRGQYKVVRSKAWRSDTVLIGCPACSAPNLLTDATILPDGTVQPSMQCPECYFHEYVKLEGWNS